jgi:hypothetical protein
VSPLKLTTRGALQGVGDNKMFKIQLSPVAGNSDTVLHASGEVLTIDGVAVDFSPLGEGEQCETTLPLIGLASRIGGVVNITVRFEYDRATAEPMQSTNLNDYIVNVSSGPIPDVIRRKPAPQPMEAFDAETSN